MFIESRSPLSALLLADFGALSRTAPRQVAAGGHLGIHGISWDPPASLGDTLPDMRLSCHPVFQRCVQMCLSSLGVAAYCPESVRLWLHLNLSSPTSAPIHYSALALLGSYGPNLLNEHRIFFLWTWTMDGPKVNQQGKERQGKNKEKNKEVECDPADHKKKGRSCAFLACIALG
eukprot:1149053-Pelagomonas_calceolata.AAC.3